MVTTGTTTSMTTGTTGTTTGSRTSNEVGAALEQRIAAVFEAHGYGVVTNAVVEGRSGATHEVDVLARTTDRLTSFSVAVECKAWAQPIEKDVVSKLHYVLGDLGLHKGVIASLAGWRSGAARAAEALGIELWGPDELRRHLGDAAFARAVAGLPATVTGATRGLGRPWQVDPVRAERTVAATGRGRLGLRAVETLARFERVLLPTLELRLHVVEPGGRGPGGGLRSSVLVNAYEPLGGGLLGTVVEEPVDLALDAPLVPALVRDAQVAATIRRAVEGRRRVRTPAAVARRDDELAALGLPSPCEGLTVAGTRVVHHPFFVGLLTSRGGQRVVAVDGWSGRLDERVGAVLTTHLAHLLGALPEAPA